MTNLARIDKWPSLKNQVTPEEWDTRVNLAACYRIADHFGWTDLIYTHISARVPGPEHHFLINPMGTLFDEITASSLVKINLDGEPVGENTHEVNRAGFVIHSAVHSAREDAKIVMHTHTDANIAISMLECGLRPLSQHAQIFFGKVGYHDYEGFAIDIDERQRLIKNLGDNPILILRNHGVLAATETTGHAVALLFHFERACRAQLAAMATGMPLITPTDNVAQKASDFVHSESSPIGKKDWPPLIRMMDRKDPSYRD
jgi:ribulose-5-phosphate 4-epimerase/fuculose-1-phosphate aldolase